MLATYNDMNNGKRIRIRHKRMSDAKEDYLWQTDPELAKLDAALTLSISYQQFLSEYTFELCYPSSNRNEFAIETLSGEHIGNCVYYNVNFVEGKAELGIMIGNRRYWNDGYGVEAIESLLDHIFNHARLERVYLTTLDWNIRAQKCFNKCGFSLCGEVQRDGSTFLLMVIHRFEWEALRIGSSSPENTTTNPD
jgi:[ribosomal protein S5]-alanine N-acetyltransferase